VVLLCDHGVHASEKVLNGYCALHRLLIAICEEYPSLLRFIDSEVAKFCKSEDNRTKGVFPNIGDFWPFLSVSTVSWRQVLPHVLSETLDRNVIWVCKAHPELSDNTAASNSPDQERLSKTFDASKVSMKMMMFHVYFLKKFHNTPDLGAIADNYDRFFGSPSNRDRSHFQKAIKEILKTTNWTDFFKHIDIKAPNHTEMTNRLKQAVKNSLRKKYHTKTTDFSRIHASGVSKILLKGESYTCNTSLQKVYLEDVWGFPAGTLFLDASCALFGFKNEHIYTVDFSHTSWLNDAIIHSGDVIDQNKRQGTHTIKIELAKLTKDVKSLYFIITAWTGLLTDILHPYILFNDPDTKQELCRYQFEEKDTGTNTAVIMAKLYRKKVGGQWEVVAIGHLGMGNAANYAPIYEDIKKKFV